MAAPARSPRGRLLLAGALVVLLVAAALSELFPLVPSAPPAPPDYGANTAWLCRPGRSDACAQPTTATVMRADGTRATVTYRPDPAAPIDCFYVYPTVSHAPGDNAPTAATSDEIGAARQQLARFSAVCRPFAPLYRQVTRHGLRKTIDDLDPGAPLRKLAYADVVAAWHAYLAKDNAGRGFVLIGHSQGAKLLARLMAEEIDGKPIAARLVSAIIPGTEIDVLEGRDVGGTFAHIPLCARAEQTGCVIAYSTYPANRGLAAARFGTTRTPGMTFACVDPATVAGIATLDADLPLWGALRQKLGTDFMELPGAISAACRRDGPVSVLAIAATGEALGEPTAALLDRLGGATPAWGLHGLDVNLAEGTLVDIVRRQAEAYKRN